MQKQQLGFISSKEFLGFLKVHLLVLKICIQLQLQQRVGDPLVTMSVMFFNSLLLNLQKKYDFNSEQIDFEKVMRMSMCANVNLAFENEKPVEI